MREIDPIDKHSIEGIETGKESLRRKIVGVLLVFCMVFAMSVSTAFANENSEHNCYNVTNIPVTLCVFIEDQGIRLNEHSFISVEENKYDKNGEKVIVCNVKISNEQDGIGQVDILAYYS